MTDRLTWASGSREGARVPAIRGQPGAREEPGLRAYEARMRPWVERVQRIPHGEDTVGAGQAAVSTAFALPAFPTEQALTAM